MSRTSRRRIAWASGWVEYERRHRPCGRAGPTATAIHLAVGTSAPGASVGFRLRQGFTSRSGPLLKARKGSKLEILRRDPN